MYYLLQGNHLLLVTFQLHMKASRILPFSFELPSSVTECEMKNQQTKLLEL
jgi:hypothetical protein